MVKMAYYILWQADGYGLHTASVLFVGVGHGHEHYRERAAGVVPTGLVGDEAEGGVARLPYRTADDLNVRTLHAVTLRERRVRRIGIYRLQLKRHAVGQRFPVERHTRLRLGVFGHELAIGHKPNSDIFVGQLPLDEAGYIKTHAGTPLTDLPGIFAAGDVADPHYKQAITAAASGCKAAIEAERYIASLAD